VNTEASTDWPSSPLGDIARVYSGGTPSRNVPAYWGGPIPWVTTTEIDFGQINTTHQSITEAGLRASAAKVAPPGTLLLAMYGQGKTRGKSALLGIAAAMNQACAAIEVGTQVDARFLLHYLSWQYEAIRSISNAGSQDNLSGELVRRIPVIVPPIPVQRAIADSLDDATKVASSLERLIAKRQAIKQGMMQQLLTGRIRIRGAAGAWPKASLGDISMFITKGATPTTYGYKWESSGVPFLRSECVSDRGLNLAQSMFISPEADRALRRSQVEDGDILMTITGYVGRVIRLAGLGRANINQHVARIRIKDLNFDAGFIYHYLSQPMMREYYETIVTGQAYPQISLRQVRETKVPAPPIDEQHAIGEALDSADRGLTVLEHRLAKARSVKQGMMQQLLTGRARLPVWENAS
jgi:type I restriction enzyme S subunit